MPILTAGAAAPEFRLASTDGKTLAFPPALGKGPLLLAFFKVSCPTCQYTFPFLERLHQQLRGQDGQIWGVAQDSVQHTTQFAKTFGVTFPILIDDPPYKVSRKYGLVHVPSLFLVAPDGRIELTSEGFSKSDLLAIQKSLAPSASAVPAALFSPPSECRNINRGEGPEARLGSSLPSPLADHALYVWEVSSFDPGASARVWESRRAVWPAV